MLVFVVGGLCFSIANQSGTAQESLPTLENGTGPQTFDELWSNYDPRKEPLDVEVLHEWSEDDIDLKIIQIRILKQGNSISEAWFFIYRNYM